MTDVHVLAIMASTPAKQPLIKALRQQHWTITHLSTVPNDLHTAGPSFFPVIVLDAGLPGVYDFVRDAQCSRAKVILLLGPSPSLRQVLLWFEAGIDMYMPTPQDPRELVARIGAALRTRLPRQVASPQEDVRQQLGTKVPLTRLESLLLRMLLINQDRLVPPPALFEAGWGTPKAKPAALRTQMKNIRRKLRTAGCALQIRTVWRKGYVLEAVVRP